MLNRINPMQLAENLKAQTERILAESNRLGESISNIKERDLLYWDNIGKKCPEIEIKGNGLKFNETGKFTEYDAEMNALLGTFTEGIQYQAKELPLAFQYAYFCTISQKKKAMQDIKILEKKQEKALLDNDFESYKESAKEIAIKKAELEKQNLDRMATSIKSIMALQEEFKKVAYVTNPKAIYPNATDPKSAESAINNSFCDATSDKKGGSSCYPIQTKSDLFEYRLIELEKKFQNPEDIDVNEYNRLALEVQMAMLKNLEFLNEANNTINNYKVNIDNPNSDMTEYEANLLNMTFYNKLA